mmetsp:Transcript_9578/g.28840  ORF Transcript_9578/g.28840 Transcript_9578/m.28840 type:complete len:247 (+) Transcript_9578:1020-1760(+)
MRSCPLAVQRRRCVSACKSPAWGPKAVARCPRAVPASLRSCRVVKVCELPTTNGDMSLSLPVDFEPRRGAPCCGALDRWDCGGAITSSAESEREAPSGVQPRAKNPWMIAQGKAAASSAGGTSRSNEAHSCRLVAATKASCSCSRFWKTRRSTEDRTPWSQPCAPEGSASKSAKRHWRTERRTDDSVCLKYGSSRESLSDRPPCAVVAAVLVWDRSCMAVPVAGLSSSESSRMSHRWSCSCDCASC